ncbi:MAG TPA: sigma-70 family RNA polymerase sigma factor [Longimicrobiaceae bacterium]|nr:sigma-70 family RNA polymerase sigma factor [Longimicrobiaceae bacterium]
MTEIELIRQAQAGDGSAIQALYRRHADRVYAIVRRLAGDDSLAEDCAQEAWVRVFRALPDFRGDALFTTWLHRIAVNSALYGRRKRERHDGREKPLPENLPCSRPDDLPLLRMRLERAMELLPDRMRQVLVLHDVEGFTHREIAEITGVAPGTCKSQLSKARARMRSLLSPTREPIEGEEVCST